MKTIITVLVVAVVVGAAVPAQAINREWSAALGFLGGLLVANSANSGPVYQERVYVQPSCPPPPVYQERVYVPVPYPERVVVRERPRGRYEYRRQPVWVPGRWVHVEGGRRGHHRREGRVWEPGYYRYETVRVWVDVACDSDW